MVENIVDVLACARLHLTVLEPIGDPLGLG